MPSSTPKQARFMSAVAHSPEFAKKVGVPQSVGKDFHNADKARASQTASADVKGKKPNRHLIKALRSKSTGGTSTGSIGGASA